jgi:hypothetical protein
MTRSRLASVLAVLAVAAVVGTAVTAVAAYTHRDDGRGERRVLVVAGSGARVEVRATGWSLEPRDAVIYYVGRSGEPAVGVTGPAVYDEGYCARAARGSNRGFVGFTRATTGQGARDVSRDLGRAWLRAVARTGDHRGASPHSRMITRVLRLAEGTAVASTGRIAVADPGPCDAPVVVVTVASLDVGSSVASLVLVRDAGRRGTLTDAQAGRILGSLRPTG